jgi:hypothetical protein
LFPVTLARLDDLQVRTLERFTDLSLFATHAHKRILAKEPGVLSDRLDRVSFA